MNYYNNASAPPKPQNIYYTHEPIHAPTYFVRTDENTNNNKNDVRNDDRNDWKNFLYGALSCFLCIECCC